MEFNKKDIYNKTIEVRKNIAKNALAKIEWKIANAVDEGKLEIFVKDITISLASIEELRNRGFCIKLYCGDVDNYSNFYQGYLCISWKPTLWDKIVKMFFKGSR